MEKTRYTGSKEDMLKLKDVIDDALADRIVAFSLRTLDAFEERYLAVTFKSEECDRVVPIATLIAACMCALAEEGRIIVVKREEKK